MKNLTKDVADLFDCFWDRNLKKATKYCAKDYTMKLTHIGKIGGKERISEYKLTIGRPNYLERIFIKKCIKAEEPFPIKKIQLKFYPKKK